MVGFRQAPEHGAFEQIFDPNNKYTDRFGLPTDRIDFTVVADGTLPGTNRRLKLVFLIFLFDEVVTPPSSMPTLTARLTKAGVLDGAGNPVEIVFTSPGQGATPSFQLPAALRDQDPSGAWTFRMVTADNLDAGNPKSQRGLIDVLLVVEYEHSNS